MADPERIEATLLAGAERARALATPFLNELRSAVGLRSLAQGPTTQGEQGQPGCPANVQAVPRAGRQVLFQAGGRRWALAAAELRRLIAPKEAGASHCTVAAETLMALGCAGRAPSGTGGRRGRVRSRCSADRTGRSRCVNQQLGLRSYIFDSLTIQYRISARRPKILVFLQNPVAVAHAATTA
jgi:hypothetical protein